MYKSEGNYYAEYLENKGVTILEDCDVIDIEDEGNDNKVIFKLAGKDDSFLAKFVTIAPGRTGAGWMQGFLDKHNIPYNSQSIEIGVRVETRKEVLKKITDVIYDPTIFIKLMVMR